MDSKKFEIMMKAVELGSFTKASEEVGYTQSGLTHLVDSLEKEVGFNLLERNHNGVRLTTKGKELLPAINEFLQSANNLENKIKEVALDKDEVIKIAAYASMAIHWIPEILYRFKRLEPKVDVDLRMVDHALEPFELLEKGQADLVFASKQDVDFCDWVPLYEDVMYAILPKDYPLTNSEVFPISEFSNKNFLMPYGSFDIDVDKALKPLNVKTNTISHSVDDETVIRMVSKGLGVSMMSEMMIKGRTSEVTILPVDPPAIRELGMATHKKRKYSANIEKLKDCVKQYLSEIYN